MGNAFTRINGKIEDRDVFFLYNDLQSEDSTIDNEFVSTAKKVIKDNKEKEDALVILHTAKGDLICGQKLAQYLKDNYGTVNYYIPERCGEAGTLMALTADFLSYEGKSDITPCDPQVVCTNGEIVPTYLFRKLIQNKRIFDPIDEGRYFVARDNFKKIANDLFGKKSEDVISRMLDKTCDHYEPLYDSDFRNMGVLLTKVNHEHFKLLTEAHNEILKMQKGKKITNVILGSRSGYVYQNCYTEGKETNKGYVKSMTLDLYLLH